MTGRGTFDIEFSMGVLGFTEACRNPRQVLRIVGGQVALQSVLGLPWRPAVKRRLRSAFSVELCIYCMCFLVRVMCGFYSMGKGFFELIGVMLACFVEQFEEFAVFPSAAEPWMHPALGKSSVIDREVEFGDPALASNGSGAKKLLKRKVGLRFQCQQYADKLECMMYWEACRFSMRSVRFA